MPNQTKLYEIRLDTFSGEVFLGLKRSGENLFCAGSLMTAREK